MGYIKTANSTGNLYKIREEKRKRRLKYLKNYRIGEEYQQQRGAWLNKHPNYYQSWVKRHPDYYKKWRLRNKIRYDRYQRQWNKKNHDKRNLYIRNYMREYRKRNSKQ